VPQIGKHRLDRLQPEHLDAFYSWLATQRLRPNTIVQIHRIVSRALKVACKRGKVARNVASLVDAPIGKDVDIEPLTQEEARKILAAASGWRNGARWSVALAVGIRKPCRKGAGVTWPDHIQLRQSIPAVVHHPAAGAFSVPPPSNSMPGTDGKGHNLAAVLWQSSASGAASHGSPHPSLRGGTAPSPRRRGVTA
jgi:hypothetical protein